MKFDFVIGNPPYQSESTGDDNAFSAPLYDKFLDGAYEVSDCVEMIHPARFLFNAGGTLKSWNRKMLDDPHLKVLWYEAESSKIFPNTSIMGGVAVTYHDVNQTFTPIKTFTAFPIMNDIKGKVWDIATQSLMDIVANRGQYRFSDLAYEEQPEEMKKVTDRRISPPVFERMPSLFTEEKPDDGHEYIQIYGKVKNNRVYRWFRRDYLAPVDSLDKYKITLAKADGAAGQLGKPIPARIIGKPVILGPNIGYTETYISVGSVKSEKEANAISKYVKTKFARAMLGIIKVTPNYAKPVWEFVPMQDFTSASDICWSKPVNKIDQQLYAKYGLNKDEIEFIESYVKELN